MISTLFGYFFDINCEVNKVKASLPIIDNDRDYMDGASFRFSSWQFSSDRWYFKSVGLQDP